MPQHPRKCNGSLTDSVRSEGPGAGVSAIADKLIAATAVYIVLIALASMSLRAALRLQADREAVQQIELYMFISFALAFVVGTAQQLLAIRHHQRGRRRQAGSGGDLSPSDPGYVQRWEGFYWQADVAADGSVGKPRAVAGELHDWTGKGESRQGRGKAVAMLDVENGSGAVAENPVARSETGATRMSS